MAMNHFDSEGRAHMVDVGDKDITPRRAVAAARVRLDPALLQRVLDRNLTKGDVLGVARLAGIQAAKKTSDLIPLAHPLALSHAAVEFTSDQAAGILDVQCTVQANDRTGVEMEAICGATLAALTVYDMCKGEDRSIIVEQVRLLAKSGGRSGTYLAEGIDHV
jgi:cyclic pyranopterin phosphate synthase